MMKDKNRRPRGKRRRLETFDIVNIAILIFLSLFILYPFYNSLIVSITSQTEYVKTPFLLFPKQVNFDAYKYILGNKGLIYGYRSTLFILLVGVPLNMLLTVCAAFVLTRKSFPGKRIFFFMIIITMFFSGGLIPVYLTMMQLHLNNTLWSVILLHGMNTFYFILCCNYMKSIPESMEESAKIDGANDIVILSKIYLPLCTPIIATMFLFYAVDRWNEWFYAMLLIKKDTLIPLQVLLRNMVFVSLYESKDAAMDSMEVFFGEGIKMAVITVTMLPIMLFYPFVQRYFVKGIMVGAVKA